MPEIKRTILLLPLFLLALTLRSQQRDTVPLLHPEELAEKDIYIPLENPNKAVKIISGSRFPVSSADLPFSTHVITREEIRRNGYETLVDALKMVPGMRVSQPGSATDGETFLMRGLLGNTYAKILINDVPIKPTYLASMPIGAQLPIKEAERIEIIYGAGTAIYGSDGAAGVINIITRESDKPVFMQADLSVGGGVYSGVNVMFGGRLGRDNRVFKYFAYGSNVIMEDRPIFYDTANLYRPSHYTDDTLHLLSDNYAGEVDNAVLTSAPHLSRKFGFNLKYKRFTLSGETMYRRDHSSLGLNTVAASYRNPLTFTGEAILRFNLNIYKEKEKHNRKTDITYYRYSLDGRSSVLFVNNSLAKMLYQSAAANARLNNNDSTMQYYDGHYDQFIDGLRYMYGFSNEYRVEHVRNYELFKSATLTFGANTKMSVGAPFSGLYRRPVLEDTKSAFRVENFSLDDIFFSTIFPNSGGVNESNVFGQVFYNGKNLKLAGGFNYTLFGFGLGEHFYGDFRAFSPRISGLWEFQENVNIRTAFGTAFRPPNPYYEANSYAVFSNSRGILYRPEQLPIVPEKTTSWESGIRWKSEGGGIGADVTWFLNKTNNLIRYGKREEWFGPDSSRYAGRLGYSNFADNSIRFTGGQASIFFTNEINGRVSTGLISYSWLNYKNEELRALDAEGLVTPPKGRIWQIRNNFNPFKKSLAILDLIRYREIATTGGDNPKNKFWTFDITCRYSFTDRFDGYFKIINLLNKKYSGILPEGDPQDLLRYNPQTGFFLRLGMNYYIE